MRTDPLRLSVLALALCALGLAACDSSTTPDPDGPFDPNPGDSFDATFGPDFVPASFVVDVTHPYFPLVPGTMYRYEGETEDGTEVILIEVMNETREVAGVTSRIVRDRVFVDGALAEDTFDWFAQDDAGNVWYLGEETCEVENDVCVNTNGAWEAGVDGARAGIYMPATPAVGQRYYQEYYDDEAEDRAAIVGTGETVTGPSGTYTDCVKTLDTTPLDPDVEEHKFYCPGIGLVLEINLENDEEIALVEVTTP